MTGARRRGGGGGEFLGLGGQDAARLQALRSAADLGTARRARAAGAAAVAATGAGPRAARRALGLVHAGELRVLLRAWCQHAPGQGMWHVLSGRALTLELQSPALELQSPAYQAGFCIGVGLHLPAQRYAARGGERCAPGGVRSDAGLGLARGAAQSGRSRAKRAWGLRGE